MAVDGGKYGYGRRRLRDVERRGDGSAMCWLWKREVVLG